MAVIISNGDTTLSTSNGFYACTNYNLSPHSSTYLTLNTSPRQISLTFASSGNNRGIVIALNPDSSTVDRGLWAGLQENKGSCTADSSTDRITLSSHGLSNGSIVSIAGTAPGGLVANYFYWVINADTNTFQLASSSGGSAINLTSNGSSLVLWATRAFKELSLTEIVNATNRAFVGIFVPIVWDTPYAVDTSASKWRFNFDRPRSGTNQGTSSYWSLRTSDGTNPFYATWNSTAATFSSGNDCVICKDKVVIDMTATFKGYLGTGDSNNPTCCIVCRSTDPTPDNVSKLLWDDTPASSFTLTLDGMCLLGAHSGFRCGTSTNRIPIAQQANIVIKRVPSVGTAGRSGIYNIMYLGYASGLINRKASLFFYGEKPATGYTAVLAKNSANAGTATMTIATPCVVSRTDHNLEEGSPLKFTTTGALPTGVTAGTIYYARNITANTFNISATVDGALINTSGTQSGTHTLDTVIQTTTNTGWSVGNIIFVGHRKTRGSYDTYLERTISSISGDLITLSSNLTDPSMAGGKVAVLKSCGIKISQDDTTSFTQYLESTSNCVYSGVYLYNVFLQHGSGQGTALDDSSNMILPIMEDCVVYGKNFTTLARICPNELGSEYRNNFIIRPTPLALYEGNSLAAGKTGEQIVRNNDVFFPGQFISFSSTIIRFKGYENYLDGGGSSVIVNLNNAINPYFYDNYLWGNSGSEPTYPALMLGTTIFTDPQKRIYGNKYNNHSCAIAVGLAAQNKVLLHDEIFGDVYQNDIDVSFAQGAYADVTLISPDGAINVSETYVKETTNGGMLQILDYDNTYGDYRSWATDGKFFSNNGKIDQIPYSSTALINTYKVATGEISNSKIYISLYSQINNSAYYAGTHILPTLTVNYDNGTEISAVSSANTSRQKLACALTPTTDNTILLVSVKTQSDASTTAERTVTFDTMTITMRKFGYSPSTIIKSVTKQTKELFADLVPLSIDATIAETNEATVAGYTGISINHLLPLITVSSPHSFSEFYDYCQYNLSLEENLDKTAFYYTVDGGLSFNTEYDLTISADITATDKILRMGTNTLTLDGGVWTGTVDGSIDIISTGSYPLNIGSETVTFSEIGTYDLSGGNIAGTIELVNNSGGNVTVVLDSGVSYTNTGPNITVDIPPVAITVSDIVSGSRLYIYDTVAESVLYNDIPISSSQIIEITATGNLTEIKIRKAGYKTFETTITPGSAGASITASQEDDESYNPAYNNGMSADWSINTSTKKISRNTTNWNTIRDFHSYFNALFAGESYMEFDVPTSAFTKYEIQFENGYNFYSATDFQKLKTGSIYDPVADDLWGNITTIGSVTTETIYIVQNSTKISPYWSAGNIDILLKVKSGGVLIDSGTANIYCRDFNSIFDHTALTITEGGKNYAPLTSGSDTNNQTSAGVVSGYSDIILDETGAIIDITDVAIDEEDTPANYTIGIDCAGRTVQEAYEYLKYVTRNGSITTINSDNGEEFYRFSTYPEIKNAPLGQLIGGIFYGARGVFLTNVATADVLKYVLTDNLGTTHQSAVPPVEIRVTNIVAGSRIQIYDLTNDIELANEVVVGTTFSLEKSYTEDLDIRVRLAYVDGVTAKDWFETQGTFTSSGMNMRASQEDDAVYNYIGIDGATVTECSITGTTLIVNIDDPDNSTTWSRIYAFECYWLTTEGGMRDQELFIEASDAAHYVFEGGLKVKNLDTINPLVISGGFAVDSNGSSSALLDLTGGMIFTASTEVVPFSYSSGSGLSSEEHAKLLSIPTADENKDGLLKKKEFLALK